MTATEQTTASAPQYRCWREVDIPPVRHAGEGHIIPAPELDDPGERGCQKWRHRSISGKHAPCTLTYLRHSRQWFCDHPAHVTYAHQKPCSHLQNLMYWRTYHLAYRHFAAMTAEELRERDLEYARIERGKLAEYRGWDVEREALGEVVRERTMREAS